MSSSAALPALPAAGGSTVLAVPLSPTDSDSAGDCGFDLEGLGSPRTLPQQQRAASLPRMVEAARVLLECLGEDVTREGLVKTPLRMAKALLSLTAGYEMVRSPSRIWPAAAQVHALTLPLSLLSVCFPPLPPALPLSLRAQSPVGVVGDALFESSSEEMVLVRDIEINSMCEHHMLPFFGRVHIAYLPAGRVLGLSKLARIADVFASRLQIQERLTEQVAKAVQEACGARGVAVMVDCQ